MKLAVPFLLLAAAAAICCGGASLADSQSRTAPQPVTRPADVSRWVTLGTTLHMRSGDQHTPEEMRHVQIEPEAYERLLRDGAFPDGTQFAVTIHALKMDGAGDGALYAEDAERALVLEILDSHHPDGRRFYVYPPGTVSAQPLPPGNQCAVCHNAHGMRQGTFTQFYPTIAAGHPHSAQ